MPEIVLKFQPPSIARSLDASPVTTTGAVKEQALDGVAIDQVDWSTITHMIAAGNKEAFAIYYQHHFDLMYNEVSRLSNLDESTCLDIVQDAMIKVIRGIKPISQQPQLAAWTRAVARNATYDWFRQRQRRRVQPQAISEADVPLANDRSAELEAAARLLWIEEQLKNLPKELQSMIEWRYRLGWSLKKIGHKLGLKTGAVDGRIRRALEKLKAKADEVKDE